MNPNDAPYIYLFILGDEQEHYYNIVSARAWGIDQATNVITDRLGVSVWDNICILQVIRWNPDLKERGDYETVFNGRIV